MSNRTRILRLLLLSVLTGLAAGCATTPRDEVSSQPWNRPQSWEGAAGFGGFRTPGSPGY